MSFDLGFDEVVELATEYATMLMERGTDPSEAIDKAADSYAESDPDLYQRIANKQAIVDRLKRIIL